MTSENVPLTREMLQPLCNLLFPGLAYEIGNAARNKCVPGGWNLITDIRIVDDDPDRGKDWADGPRIVVFAWTPHTGTRSVTVVHQENYWNGGYKKTFKHDVERMLGQMAQDCHSAECAKTFDESATCAYPSLCFSTSCPHTGICGRTGKPLSFACRA